VYVVDAASPVMVKLVPVLVPIWVKFVQLLPRHSSIKYPVTPALSIEAPQVSVMALPDAGAVITPVGVLGGWVSPPPPLLEVVALTILEYAL
jgi:hypothetical protein